MSLTLKEASERLKVSVTTVRRYIKAGKLKASLREGLYGQEYIIAEQDLHHFLKEKFEDFTVIDSIEVSQERQGVTVPIDIMSIAMQRAMEDTLNKIALSYEQRLQGIEQGLQDELKQVREQFASTTEQLGEKIDRGLASVTEEILKSRSETHKRKKFLGIF